MPPTSARQTQLEAPVADSTQGGVFQRNGRAGDAPLIELDANPTDPDETGEHGATIDTIEAKSLTEVGPTLESGDSLFERGPHDVEAVVAIFRTLVLGMALLLPQAFAPHTFADAAGPRRALMWLGIVAATYNIGAVLASVFPSRFGLRRPLIIAMDAILVSAWIALSGQFGLFPFYTIVVVLAGLWGRTFGAILTAVACDFLYLLVWANVAGDPDRYLPLTTHMAISCVTLPLLGTLVGYLVELQERERARRQEGQMLIANYEHEIDLSRQLQPALFGVGRTAPQFPDLDLGVAARMARALGGGDFFDAIPVEGGGILLCIADVSGKSARAQSRLPLLKYALRALAPLHVCPRDLVPCLNALISPELGGELYIAACCVLIDPKAQCIEWCNAGHIPPLFVRVRRDQLEEAPRQISHLATNTGTRIVPLETCGPPLGMFEDAVYKFDTLPWRPGDALLLYTDGLSDAFSFDGAEDGEAQVCGLAARLATDQAPASRSADRLLEMALAVLDAERPATRLVLPPLPRRGHREGTTKRTPGMHRDDITIAVARFKERNTNEAK